MWQPDLKKLRETLKLTPYPINLIIEATTFCNLRCKSCPYPFLERPKGKMGDGLYNKIIDEIAAYSPQETIIWFAFMGEPLSLGKDLFKMVKYAKDKGIKNTYLNTNALFLNEEAGDGLIESGLDKIIVSIDAFNEEAYQKIRVGGNYELLKSNTLQLIKTIKERNLTKPEIVVQFIVMDENRAEEELFKKYWLKQGVTVKIRRKLGWGGSVTAEDLIIPQDKRDMPCPWLMRQMVVLWDGRVAQCDADYEGIYSAGDINKQTIFEVWNGELKKRRTRHLQNDFDFKPCSGCNDWQVGLSEIYKPTSK